MARNPEGIAVSVSVDGAGSPEKTGLVSGW
jgi:hypothetical protein